MGSIMEADQLLTTVEAAEILHTPVATLRWWRHQGTGPRAFRLGARKVMYRRADVISWLDRQYADDGEGASRLVPNDAA